MPVSPLITMELDNLGTQYVKIEIHKPATSVIKKEKLYEKANIGNFNYVIVI